MTTKHRERAAGKINIEKLKVELKKNGEDI